MPIRDGVASAGWGPAKLQGRESTHETNDLDVVEREQGHGTRTAKPRGTEGGTHPRREEHRNHDEKGVRFSHSFS